MLKMLQKKSLAKKKNRIINNNFHSLSAGVTKQYRNINPSHT